MNFLLDENFPKAARSLLEEMGHQVHDARELCPQGSDDSEVMRLASLRMAVILTTDRDFFHTLGMNHPEHHGIVVIALKKPTRVGILKRLKWFLEKFGDTDVAGKSFQLRDVAWIVYPPQ